MKLADECKGEVGRVCPAVFEPFLRRRRAEFDGRRTDSRPRFAERGGHALTNDDDAQPRRSDDGEQEVLLHPVPGFAREFESVEDEERRKCGCFEGRKDIGELGGDAGSGLRHFHFEPPGKIM